MSRATSTAETGTYYRAIVRRSFTRDDGTAYASSSAYGPYSRPQDAKAAIRRESNGGWYRRMYPDYTEEWKIESLSGEWQEVQE